MLSLQDIVIGFLDTLMGHAVLALFLFVMMDERVVWDHIKKLPVLLLSPLGAVAVALLGGWLMPEGGVIRYALNSLAIMCMCTLWCRWTWRLDVFRAFASVCMAGVLQVADTALTNSLLQMFCGGEDAPFAISHAPFAISLMVVALISVIGALLLKKVRFGSFFRLLLEEEADPRRTALLLFSLELAMEAFLFLQGGIQSQYLVSYNLLAAALVALIVGIVVYLAQRSDAARKLQAQQDVIAQQQLYEQDLEGIRQEVRTFRHDYKNLLAGLSQQAGEGELEQLRATLSELDADFDQRIGEKIQMSTQIGNLRIPQVRSLLLSKLTAMRTKGVECRLEALYPMEAVGMDTWDFVRCLGILIDNAVEAVEGTGHPWVEIILLAQEGQVSLQVSNPWRGDIDPARFWEEGWSTKGAGRGLGLPSYLRILARYPNATSSTSWADGVFMQTLTIGGKA